MQANGSLSIWMATAEPQPHASLSGDARADICVIGAGIGGLTTAYLLAREGKDVILLEAMEVGSGETGRTTAHFFPPDEWYAGLQKSFGLQNTRLIASGYRRATDLVESIVRNEHIACQFERVDGYLYSTASDPAREISEEFEAARRAGVEVEKLERAPGLSFDTGPCVRFVHQAQFHPLRYLDGLAAALLRSGGRIYTHTRVHDLKTESGSQLVLTEHGTVRADAVVVATNTPFNNRVVMHTKQAGYRTYVIALRVPKETVPRILLWDTGDPYYYVRLQKPDPAADYELLVVGGQDHKVGQDEHPEHRYRQIEAWVRQRYPMAGVVEFRWSGEVMEPSDGIAFLGHNPADHGNVYIITGDSGNGMTHCTLGAILITDLIMGRDNAWAGLYDPSRKPVHGLSDFIHEQVNTVAQYGDWLKGGEVESAQQIPNGQGAILRQAGKKFAIYRDDHGSLHALSAACTHLGCVVTWNSAERSWDCPCHGSRFDINGAVLHGPANTPLKRAEDGEGMALPGANDSTSNQEEKERH
jgi:glycine/D-amino acid oxidase-like deaminating enzyme/nitrite reductase/ring-hydroxylating ferredoxin subunit